MQKYVNKQIKNNNNNNKGMSNMHLRLIEDTNW